MWGLILRTIGDRFGDDVAPHTADVAAAITASAQAVMDFGKAKVGDKTLVDVLVPFADTLTQAAEAGNKLPAAWAQAAEAADKAAENTAHLIPEDRPGQAAAEKSVGTPDAGATSMALIVNAIDAALFPDSK